MVRAAGTLRKGHGPFQIAEPLNFNKTLICTHESAVRAVHSGRPCHVLRCGNLPPSVRPKAFFVEDSGGSRLALMESVASMQLKKRTIVFIAAAAFGVIAPVALWADPDGADPRYTGAPGDDASACASCHTGTALNGGPGSVKIVLPNGNTYTPGVKQHITVQVSDSSQRRWGFELTARLATNPSSAQAGDLASTDSYTRVICSNGRAKPCSSSSPVQFITHTLAGTRNGTVGGVSFGFDWTPPATDSGKVILYAAGNAANGNNNDTGDRIYTTSVELTPAQAQTSRPSISEGGVVNGASFQPGIMQNSWITIKGTNLSTTTRLWSGADIVNGQLPTTLDGVSVTVDGKPAYIEYVSPTQINALSPSDPSTGTVEVKVTANGSTSDAFMTTLNAFSPAFFTFDGKYAAATHADGSLAGKTGLFSSAPNATTPVKPGETIVLYGTGFGSTSPSFPSGQLPTTVGNLASSYKVTIGGVQADVSFAGLLPNFAGLYQFNVKVPDNASDGDQKVTVEIGGATSPDAYVTVQR